MIIPRVSKLEVAAPPEPSMTTIPNVDLIEVGEWDASTGTIEFTTNHLKSILNAIEDPEIKTPRLRFGHTSWDADFYASQGYMDEQPVVGKFENLRLNSTGTKLVGDIVGVPTWLAEVLPFAYPNRSVEVYWDVKTKAGHEYEAALASVAVLGINLPAVATLEDLAALFSAEGPDGVEVMSTGNRVAARQGDKEKARVTASVPYEDVRSGFYNDFATEESGRYWWWLVQVYIDPPLVIAEDDEGGLWAITYSTAGDNVEFGDPVEVKQQFADPDGKVLARHGEPGRQYRTAAESRPAERKRPKEVKAMDPKEIRKRLGLAEDASDEEVYAKLSELNGSSEEPEEPEPEPETPEEEPETAPAASSPEPALATLDPETLRQLQEDAKLGRAAAERQRVEDRDRYLKDAVNAGKFPPARLKHWRALYDKDPDGTRATIDKLATGLIPVEERGSAKTGESTDAQSAYEESWLTPQERARVAAQREGKSENQRVTVEA